MKCNRLKLNSLKTEVLWCSSSRRQHVVPTDDVQTADAYVHPVPSVRNLGVQFDSALSMSEHVSKTVSICFAALRRIRSVRGSLSKKSFLDFVRALVISMVDYCNPVVSCASDHLLNRLQLVLNDATNGGMNIFHLYCASCIGCTYLSSGVGTGGAAAPH